MATKPDYHVFTFQTDERPFPWRWEIRRYSKPMGVKLGSGGYQSQSAAEFAGKNALAQLALGFSRAGLTASSTPSSGGKGPDLFRKACEFGLEGLVSKGFDCPYRSGRAWDWIKVKIPQALRIQA
jgi:hypothetical protein